MASNACEYCLKDESRNNPIHGVHTRMLSYYNIYPENLHIEFRKTFDLEDKLNTSCRRSPAKWRAIILQSMMEYINCPCGTSGFAHRFIKQKSYVECPNCHSKFPVLVNRKKKIYLQDKLLIPRSVFEEGQDGNMNLAAEVTENKKSRGLYGLKNMSNEVWECFMPNYETKKIGKNLGAPIWLGLRISVLDDGSEWKIQGSEDEQ